MKQANIDHLTKANNQESMTENHKESFNGLPQPDEVLDK